MEAGIFYPVGLSGMKLQKNRVFPHFCRRNNSPEKSLPNKRGDGEGILKRGEKRPFVPLR